VRPKTALLLPTLIACALAVVGCHYTGAGGGNTGATAGGISPGGASPADVDSVIAKLNSFTDELVKAVESASDPNAGVASAQTLLDARKSELTESIAALKRDARFQQDAAAKSKWNEAEADDTFRVHGLVTKYFDASMRDPAFKSRLDKLVGDYDSMFKDSESR
jgi:hypothetical protein